MRRLAAVFTFLAIAVSVALSQSLPFPGPGAAVSGGCVTTPILLTTTGTGGTSQWTNSTGCTNFKIEVIGAGASGSVVSAAGAVAVGGAAGGYCRKNTVVLSGTGPWNYNIGAGGGSRSGTQNGSSAFANTWFCNASVSTNCTTIIASAVVVGARGATGSTQGTAPQVAGNGGLASSGIGDVCFSGGNSGGIASGTIIATGGGGAGGSTADGAASPANTTSSTSSAGGAGGTVSGGAAGALGGGNGGNGTLFDATHGAGGGGGGTVTVGGTSGAPGNCGAGSGGAAAASGTATTPAGANGCILITPLS